MMLEELAQKVRAFGKNGRRGIAAGLLGLTAIGAGGCAATISELTEGEEITLLGAAMGSSSDAEIARLAPYFSLLGQMRYQKEVVREGRTQVNVNPREETQNQNVPENVIYTRGRYFPAPGFTWANPENPGDLTIRRSIGLVFAANYRRDFNNDMSVDLNEFVGVKNRFYDTESILLVLYSPESQGEAQREIRWKIYSPNGTKLAEDSVTTAAGEIEIGANPDFASYLLRTGGYGNYVIVWSSQGMTETNQFEIAPAPTRPNN
ncbi:MAG: hypothetical protein NTW17_01950 [Candidatus Pacearchaeota archaeon]|nr:hypothetical protein [Candidatus Pacearchaeota archaeon]